jgi:hypothetical protein
MYTSGAKISRNARPTSFFKTKYYWIPSYFGRGEVVPLFQERVESRRIRPDQKWLAGVGVRTTGK